MISTKLSKHSQAHYTSPDAIAARIGAEIEAFARKVGREQAIKLLEGEIADLRLATMSGAELEKEIGHIAPDYAHSVRRLRLAASQTDVISPEKPDAPWSA